MRNDLELLLKLQVIDYDLGELERSKDYLPDMMENLRREVEEATTKLEDSTKLLTDSRLTQTNLELELKGNEAELQKYQQQMMSIKTNREYDALVTEIDNLKRGISDKETTLLETIETIGNVEKELTLLEETKDRVIENNTKQLGVLQTKMDSIGDKAQVKETARQSVVSEIPKPTLSTYERVRRGRGGRAVVAVKKKACSSCFKALTPKKIQEIKRSQRVYTCDYCGCMLFWDMDASNG